VLDQERALQALGLSLSMVSSRCVELQNAPIHAISRSLPGGVREQGNFAHLPIVQLMRKLYMRNLLLRRQFYQEAEKRIVSVAADTNANEREGTLEVCDL
jgi:hypothetical protein